MNFLNDWIQKRETWPVAPVDLRYDRTRKVWTVPNGFRIIQAHCTGEVGIPAGATNPDITPLNINSVYNAGGSEVSQPKITVTNPDWGQPIPSGEKFYAFYDTKDCTYYPIAMSGKCPPKVTGTGDISVSVSDSGGCKTYTVSGCFPKVTGVAGTTVTVSEIDGCKTYTVSGSGDGCTPTLYPAGAVTVTPTGECDWIVSSPVYPSQCLPKVSGTGDITVTVTVTGDECKTL